MAARVPVAQRREQLVRAAVRVMLRDGVHAATTRAIAAEAGVTLAILHYCFETKTDLLRLAYTTVLEQTLHQLATAPRHPQQTPAERVEEDLLVVVLAAEDDAGALQLLHEFDLHALRHPDLADLPALRRETARRATAAWLVRVGQECGLEWDGPVEELADAVSVLLDGVVAAWLVERDGERARTQVRRFAAALVRRSEPAAVG
ncbi:TetR/AcrR family transcriptional regulator [Rhodococcus aerolatus]